MQNWDFYYGLKRLYRLLIGGSAGNVFYVDSNNGNAVYDGLTPESPVLTIAAALALCTANKGDRIVLLPRHAETISAAAGITCSVAGVEIVSQGIGEDRAQLTFGTSTAASVLISATTKIKNVIGIAAIDGLTNPFNVQAADCELDIEWRDGSSAIEAARAVLTNASADRFKCDLVYRGYTGGDACVNAVRLVGCDGGRVNVDFYGKASTAVVEFVTTASTNVKVAGTFYVSGTTDFSKNVVDTVTGSTWSVVGFDAAASSAFSGGSAASVSIDDLTPLQVGSTFVVKKTMTSSAILASAAVDLTGVSSGGEIMIEEVILKTDGTGLAAGTAVKVITNNANGNPVILQTAVSGLGANKTIDFAGASVTKIKTVLESGKKVQIQATVADCTGAGTVDVYLVCRRLAAASALAAA